MVHRLVDTEPTEPTSSERKKSPRWKVAVATLATLAVAACSAPAAQTETAERVDPQAEAMSQMLETTADELIDCNLTNVRVGEGTIEIAGHEQPFLIADFQAGYTEKATTGYFDDDGQDGVEISWMESTQALYTSGDGPYAGQSRRGAAISPQAVQDGEVRTPHAMDPDVGDEHATPNSVVIPIYADPPFGSSRHIDLRIAVDFVGVGNELVTERAPTFTSCGTFDVGVNGNTITLLSAQNKSGDRVPV